MYQDGTYQVINIPEKLYVHNDRKVVYAGAADKKTIISVAYHEPKVKIPYAKRFIISKFILDKSYSYLDEGMILDYLTTQQNVVLKVDFKPMPKQKVNEIDFKLSSVAVKGVSAKGIRIANKEIKKISARSGKEK
jgi:topoisomerase-4 subunit A